MPDDPTKPTQPPSGEDELIAAARLAAEARSDGTPPEPDLPPPDYFPGYVISREIHRGGQGVVYQAVHKGTKRKVAIKVMIEGVLASVRERTRFEREVEILAQLDHPAIVDIHDSGSIEGRFYYVMDYISGSTLDVWLSHNELTMPEMLELFATICDAVNAAHLKGVIHRDLKPANVRMDADGRPHIVDFGLAKIATGSLTGDDHPMTMTGQFIGSLPWASPEQAQGIPGMIDVRTDVYSLGVMLYQMLTGRFPYQVIGAMRDVLDNILQAEPARPSTVRRQINDEVETIVLKCLSKDRDRRYQNAGDIARDIGHYLRGEPINAKRDSGWYVLRKTARRYRGAALTAGLFLIVLVVFAISMSLLYSQKSRALADLAAETEAKTAALAAEEAEAAAKQQVIDTLETWFTAPDPTKGSGKDVTVRTIVDKAAASIGEDLADQPRTEAALRRIIGRTYFNLGLWQEAEPHLRRAWEAAAEVEGPDGEMALFAEYSLGVVLRNLGQTEEAEQLLTDVLQRARRTLGNQHKRTIETLNALAQVHKLTRNLEAAEPLYREALVAAEALDEPHPSLLAILRGNLGEVLAMQGKTDEAAGLLRGSVEALEQDKGADHPNAARARLRLGLLLKQTGKPDQAEVEFRRAVEVLEATLEPTHNDLLAARLYLATLLDETDRAEEARPLYADIVASAEVALPAAHPALAWYRHLYGRNLLNAGRLAEARPLLEQAVEGLQGANHPRAVDAMQTLLRLYEELGEDDLANDIRQQLPTDDG
ncbi:Serine/threonine protein kinase PrkC, regulator of stationary phase [hydrothermal vent metagenome]|uniref:Serine/threonine protein kinase PrkC, regulator of stationary phase n=1 Tax=hydrothermal vent metagenome TaxID=652676 RepID=A0A3B1E1I8_9ZZZZ